MNRDEDNLIFRKFGNIHARLLLYRQDQLAELEAKLSHLDREDAKSCPVALRSREIDECRTLPYSRKALMEDIEVKSREYREFCVPVNVIGALTLSADDLVVRLRSFVSLPAPRQRAFKIFATSIIAKMPLCNKEMGFLEQSSDLVTLAGGEERGLVCMVLGQDHQITVHSFSRETYSNSKITLRLCHCSRPCDERMLTHISLQLDDVIDNLLAWCASRNILQVDNPSLCPCHY